MENKKTFAQMIEEGRTRTQELEEESIKLGESIIHMFDDIITDDEEEA